MKNCFKNFKNALVFFLLSLSVSTLQAQVNFTKVSPSGISPNNNTIVEVIDYDNDGLEDLIVKESNGGICIYKNLKIHL